MNRLSCEHPIPRPVNPIFRMLHWLLVVPLAALMTLLFYYVWNLVCTLLVWPVREFIFAQACKSLFVNGQVGASFIYGLFRLSPRYPLLVSGIACLGLIFFSGLSTQSIIAHSNWFGFVELGGFLFGGLGMYIYCFIEHMRTPYERI